MKPSNIGGNTSLPNVPPAELENYDEPHASPPRPPYPLYPTSMPPNVMSSNSINVSAYPPGAYPSQRYSPIQSPHTSTTMTSTVDDQLPSYATVIAASYAAPLPYPPQNLGYPAIMPYPPLNAAPTNVSSQIQSHQLPPYSQQFGGPTQYPPYPPITNQHPIIPTIIGHSQSHQQFGFAAPVVGVSSPPVRLEELGNPTVKPVPNFNPYNDAEKLRNALQIVMPKENVVIDILCLRSLEQRLEIASKYQNLTGTTLTTEIKMKFDSNFQKILLALLTPRIDFFVQQLNEAFEFYDYDSMIDIMCILSNYEMYALKSLYLQKFQKPLETNVEAKTSVHFKHFLLAICQCNRDETGITNAREAQNDAQNLVIIEDPYRANEINYFVDIFTKRNFKQIKLISEEYLKATGQSIEKLFKSKLLFEDKQGYLCIVRYSEDKLGFYAKRLHRSMAGLGTNDNQLIRLIVTRSEIDLLDIKYVFHTKYGKSLRSWIKGDTSGYYKYCLYKLIGEERSNK